MHGGVMWVMTLSDGGHLLWPTVAADGDQWATAIQSFVPTVCWLAGLTSKALYNDEPTPPGIPTTFR